MTEPIGVAPPATAAAPSAAARPKLRVAELDLLRFIAAAAVMLYHFTYALHMPGGPLNLFPAMGRVTRHGYLGVNLFFMISGFVIVWTARDRRPSEFVVSRIGRLYPEYWICVVISAIAFAGTGFRAITLSMVAVNLTMIPGILGVPYVDVVYWTLFVELKFYFFLWLLSLARQMPRIETWMYVWLALTAYCFLFDAPHVVRAATIYPFSPLFIAGALFFLIRAEGPTVPRAVGILMCVGFAMRAAVADMPGFVEPADITAATRLESRLIVVACFALFTIVALRKRGDVPFASRMAFLGMLTYPLYLVHNVGKVLVLKPLAAYDRWVALASAILVSVTLAALLARVVERYWRRPFLDRLTRLLVKPRPDATRAHA